MLSNCIAFKFLEMERVYTLDEYGCFSHIYSLPASTNNLRKKYMITFSLMLFNRIIMSFEYIFFCVLIINHHFTQL